MDDDTTFDDTTFDPALVRRLSRRALRPGVVDPGRARAVLARHRGMTAGLPLAEVASRYVDPVPQHAGSTVPIVYAQPAPPPPSGRPASAGPDSATPGPGVGATGTGGPPARAATSPPVVRASPLIQRKVAAPPAPAHDPRASLGDPGDLTARAPTPPDRAGSVPPPRSAALGPVVAYRPAASRGGGGDLAIPGPAAPRNGVRTDSPVPTVVPRPGPDEGPLLAVPAPTAPAPTAPVPTAPVPTAPTPTAPTPSVVAHPAPRTYAEPPAGTAPPAVVSTWRPHARPGGDLPLVDLATATAPAGRVPPGAAGRPAPEPHQPEPHQPARRPEPHRPEAAPVDVAHLADLVHHRIVRRLAVEAERRGSRR